MFDWKFLFVFIGLSLFNVIFSTVRSLLTINGGKTTASIISGAYYAFYNIMIIYTVADFPMWQKCVITFVCNVIGVFVVKWAEEKARKDKLWLVKMTIPTANNENAQHLLKQANISFNYVDISKYFIFDTYCESKKETDTVLKICEICGGKAFATENKLSL